MRRETVAWSWGARGRAVVVAGALVAGLLGGETHAEAQETYAYEERTPATETRWYGWQIILADAATVGLSLATKDGHVAAVGYVGAAPLVHLAHLQVGRAGISLALRVVAPLAGAALGYGLLSGVDCRQGSLSSPSSACTAWGAATAIGAISGILAASVIDAALLAREDVPVDARRGRDRDTDDDARTESARASLAEARREERRVRIQPSASPTAGGAMAGITGTF